MGIAAKIDDFGKPAWIGLLIVSFFIFPPLTVALLVFLVWSGRMGFCGGPAQWQEQRERWQEQRDHWRGMWQQRMQCGRGRGSSQRSSGNWAFDEYREETLRRLEEEQREFKDFLERLRRAKDKAEFDQFMAEQGRRRNDADPGQPQQG